MILYICKLCCSNSSKLCDQTNTLFLILRQSLRVLHWVGWLEFIRISPNTSNTHGWSHVGMTLIFLIARRVRFGLTLIRPRNLIGSWRLRAWLVLSEFKNQIQEYFLRLTYAKSGSSFGLDLNKISLFRVWYNPIPSGLSVRSTQKRPSAWYSFGSPFLYCHTKVKFYDFDYR